MVHKDKLQRANDKLANDLQLWGDPLNIAAGVCTEAGELIDIVRKMTGGKKVKSTDDTTNLETKLRHEMADVLVYLLQLASLYKIDIEDAYLEKEGIIRSRKFKKETVYNKDKSVYNYED